ncbi:Photosynthetic NDH subunit of lumenal location 4, chloroplastic, partial [Cucurbita argyrosperma subsp. argyrosperma]
MPTLRELNTMPLLENPFASSNYVPSGLGYCFIAMGSDEEVPYVFDSSYKRARPLTLRIGVGK